MFSYFIALSLTTPFILSTLISILEMSTERGQSSKISRRNNNLHLAWTSSNLWNRESSSAGGRRYWTTLFQRRMVQLGPSAPPLRRKYPRSGCFDLVRVEAWRSSRQPLIVEKERSWRLICLTRIRCLDEPSYSVLFLFSFWTTNHPAPRLISVSNRSWRSLHQKGKVWPCSKLWRALRDKHHHRLKCPI